jgi:hypothetical protein
VNVPVLSPAETYDSVTAHISGIVLERNRGWGWLLGFAVAFGLFSVLMASLFWLFFRGVGIWGINMPVAARLSPPYCCSFTSSGGLPSTGSPRR